MTVQHDIGSAQQVNSLEYLICAHQTNDNNEEDINMKNQYKIKNLLCPQENSDAVCKSYVDNFLNDSSIIKDIEHIDLNDRNLTNARFIQVNQLPQIDSHLTAKLNDDNAIDQDSKVRNNQDNDFNNNN